MNPPDLSRNEEWRDHAVCRCMDTSLFYSDKEETGNSGHYPPEVKEACKRCPVRTYCLQYAIDHREVFGYWAGTTPTDRKKMLRGTAICRGCGKNFRRTIRGQQYYCDPCRPSRYKREKSK